MILFSSCQPTLGVDDRWGSVRLLNWWMGAIDVVPGIACFYLCSKTVKAKLGGTKKILIIIRKVLLVCMVLVTSCRSNGDKCRFTAKRNSLQYHPNSVQLAIFPELSDCVTLYCIAIFSLFFCTIRNCYECFFNILQEVEKLYISYFWTLELSHIDIYCKGEGNVVLTSAANFVF